MAQLPTNYRFSPLALGDLPCELVSAKLSRPMTPGTVHFTIPAQRHAFRRHPDTFLTCLPYLAKAVSDPTYVGQSPHHAEEGFELVYAARADGLFVLVAVGLRPTNRGRYNVSSTYLLDADTIGRRIRKRHLLGV